MTLHPGVRRGHHRPTQARFGPDTGSDVPLRVEFTDALRPLLERYGTHPGFHLVAFTLDETVWSRELAPLAGFYPCLYVGAPWWFLDAPESIRRYRRAVTEYAGFSRTSGFIDDTRAFCSIPARHDMSRRSTPAGSPSWSPSTAWTRTRPSKSRSISRRAVRPRSSSCEVVARRPPGTAGSPRAPRTRQLLPRARGVVHRPGVRRVGDRGVHGPVEPIRGRRPQRSGRALHADLARRRSRSVRGRRQPCARPHGRRARGVAGLLR